MIYRPLTATPFKCSTAYKETEPCEILKPYVRCFWGGEYQCSYAETEGNPTIVIPDTCVDIIYRMDSTGNIVFSDFNGINDSSFYVHNDREVEHKMSVFAIRFYAWGAYIFSEDSFAGTVNGRYDVRERFNWLDRELRSRLSEPGDMGEIIRLTEKLLINKLEAARGNELVDRAVNNMLLHRGALDISQLSKESFISSRQMERVFHEYIGITPKKLSNLVRYQFLWKDIVRQRDFDILDAVYRYGYTDTAHLMREFKRYHLMNIKEAKKIAFSDKFSVCESR